MPALAFRDDGPRLRGPVVLHDTPALDPRLRGRVLADGRACGPAIAIERGDVVLASSATGPVWLRRGASERYVTATAPVELGEDESLRDQLLDGRFLGLLPLVAFLRALTMSRRWTPPPPRAALVLDDPNLHAVTYGHVDPRELASHAERHGYQVTVASVPADFWRASRAAVRVFHDSRALSLSIHGNDHIRAELGRPTTAARSEALIGQAPRRTEAFERRTDLRVARVMVAPHETCSDDWASTLARSEIEALCYGLGVRGPDRALADWEPVDLRAAGLPVLPRRPLRSTRGELVLRAYLDQPLILGLHHRDLAAGLDVLAEAAAEIDALAGPEWGSLASIAGAGVVVRREGDVLRVRPYARRFSVSVPAGVTALAVELPPTHPSPGGETLAVVAGEWSEPLPRGDGPQWIPVTGLDVVELALRRSDAFDHRRLRPPRRSAWAVARRVAVEGRDRLAGVGGSVSRRRRARA